ncbi:hypothetical protein [Porphyromonas sp.]|uniref:hypothetical protein n=1 Tax=Porphyromonas sp. TaxID=1924944 RepID=UPI003AB45DA2
MSDKVITWRRGNTPPSTNFRSYTKVAKKKTGTKKSIGVDALYHDEFIHVSMEEIGNSSVEIFTDPVRNWKILRTYDSVLPKFHFILPKFHFVPRWRISIFHGSVEDFLGRDLMLDHPLTPLVPEEGYEASTLDCYAFRHGSDESEEKR